MAADARRLLALLVVCALASAPLACVQDDGSYFNPIKQLTEISDDQERSMGHQFDRELQKHVEFVDDPVVLEFVNDLGQDLVKRIEPQPYVYRFRVIKDPQLNAFAVPGGYVYLHSGTVLAAGSIDELAGVMAHEIGHVKGHHVARMQEKALIPNILASIAGVGAAMATKQGGAMVAAQAVNEAIQLKFSREFENEADQLGTVFMARSGYDPQGMARFFERIVQEQDRNAIQLPPYLFSHPDVKDRIAAVNSEGASLTVQGAPPVALVGQMREAQARLALLTRQGRSVYAEQKPSFDRTTSDAALADTERLVAAGDVGGAIVRLTRAEAEEPNDPRLSFRLGELYEQQGRPADAIGAWRRTVRLDPSRAMVFYRIALAYKALGNRPEAAFYLEQALRRFGAGSDLQKKAEFELEKIDYRVIEAAGLTESSDSRPGEPGFVREEFPAGVAGIEWWGKVGAHFVSRDDELTVRWIDPAGEVALDEPVTERRKPYVASILTLGDAARATPGTWTVEARLGDDVVDRRTFRLVEAGAPPAGAR